MHAQNFVVYQRCDGQAVKAICEDFPQFYRVSTFALVIKAVNSVDAGTLVISPKQEKVFGVLNFVSQ